jgi:hypothetical protein
MGSLWDYPTGIALTSRNLVGYRVEATDGFIGTIDAASVVTGQAHLVVDTSSWILGKKRVIPAGVLDDIDDSDEKVHISLSKDQVESAPDFDVCWRDERDEYDSYYTTLRTAVKSST